MKAALLALLCLSGCATQCTDCHVMTRAQMLDLAARAFEQGRGQSCWRPS